MAFRRAKCGLALRHSGGARGGIAASSCSRAPASRSGASTAAHKRRLQRAASSGAAGYDLFRRHILFTFQAVLAASEAIERTNASVSRTPRRLSLRFADPNELMTMDADSSVMVGPWRQTHAEVICFDEFRPRLVACLIGEDPSWPDLSMSISARKPRVTFDAADSRDRSQDIELTTSQTWKRVGHSRCAFAGTVPTIVLPTALSAACTANSRSFTMAGPRGQTRSQRSPLRSPNRRSTADGPRP
jgi:hypothetical protein